MAQVIRSTISVSELILRTSYNPKQTIENGDPEWDSLLEFKANFGFEIGEVVVNSSKEVIHGAEHVIAARATDIATLSVLQISDSDELAILLYGAGLKDETVLDRLAIVKAIIADGGFVSFVGKSKYEKIANFIKAKKGPRKSFSARSIGSLIKLSKLPALQLEKIKGVTKDSMALKMLKCKPTRARAKNTKDIARLAKRLCDNFVKNFMYLTANNAADIAKMCLKKAYPTAEALQRALLDLLITSVYKDKIVADGLPDAIKAHLARLERGINDGSLSYEPVVVTEAA
jgi:hypothetical protein